MLLQPDTLTTVAKARADTESWSHDGSRWKPGDLQMRQRTVRCIQQDLSFFDGDEDKWSSAETPLPHVVTGTCFELQTRDGPQVLNVHVLENCIYKTCSISKAVWIISS